MKEDFDTLNSFMHSIAACQLYERQVLFCQWCLFQNCNLILLPTIPFKNFSSLHTVNNTLFVSEKSLISRFCSCET